MRQKTASLKLIASIIFSTSLIFGAAQSAQAVMIASTVNGDVNNISPVMVTVDPVTGQRTGGGPEPTTMHGDIVMSFANDLNSTTSIVGDGENDRSNWIWDFNGDPNFLMFNNSTDPLSSARVRLDLKPTMQFYEGDGFFLAGQIGSVSLGSGPLPSVLPDSVIVEFDLMDMFPGDDILNRYFGSKMFGPDDQLSSGPGQLPAQYFDDAIIRSATITLTRALAVPEPAALMLIGGALFVWPARRRQR